MKALIAGFSLAVGVLVTYLVLPQARWIPRAGNLLDYPGEVSDRHLAADLSFNNKVWGEDADSPTTFDRVLSVATLFPSLSVEESGILSRISLTAPVVRLPDPDLPPDPVRTARLRLVATTVLKLDQAGIKGDRDNAFWHLQDTIGHLGLGDFPAAKASLARATQCKEYSDFVWAEADRRADWMQDRVGYRSSLLALDAAASVLLPEMAQIKTSAGFMVHTRSGAEQAGLRCAWSRAGALMARKSETLIGRLVGKAVCKIALSERPAGWPKHQIGSTKLKLLSAAQLAALPDQVGVKQGLAVIELPDSAWKLDSDINGTVVELSMLARQSATGLIGWLVGFLAAVTILAVNKWGFLEKFKLGLPALAICPLLYVTLFATEQTWALITPLVGLGLCFALARWSRAYLFFGIASIVTVVTACILEQFTSAVGVATGTALVGSIAWMELRSGKEWVRNSAHVLLVVALVVSVAASTSHAMFQVDKLHALTWLNPLLAILFGVASIRPLATKVAALSAGLCLAFSVIALCAHTSSVLRAEASAEKGLANMRVEVKPIDQAVNEALGRTKE